MTTAKLSQEFARTVLNADDVLDYATDWIGANMSPEDVFTDDALADWAERNEYKKE